jgi:hypothetical protein
LLLKKGGEAVIGYSYAEHAMLKLPLGMKNLNALLNSAKFE